MLWINPLALSAMNGVNSESPVGFEKSYKAVPSTAMSYNPPSRPSSVRATEVLAPPRRSSHVESPRTSKPNIKTSTQPQRRRRSSKNSLPTIHRSASSPNVRSLNTVDVSAMSAAEKRRNKLGYHRTSVACGHCRRRKIRCLLAPDDAQGRCSNCIRLKKECNFFPVDQAQQMEQHPGTASKTHSASRDISASSSSSPALPPGQFADGPENFDQYHSLSFLERDGFAEGNESRGISVNPTSLEFAQALEQPRPIVASPMLPGTPTPTTHGKSYLEDPSNSYWRLADSSPTTPGYPMFPYAPPAVAGFPQAEGAIDFTRQPVREGGWSASSRSLSFGRADGLSSYYGAPHARQGFQRPASPDLYPPSLNTSHTSSMDSMSEASSAPLSAPAGSQHSLHNLGYTNGWSGISGPPSGNVGGKVVDGIAGWYGEPTQLTQVEEETGAQFLGSGPSIYYSSEHYRPE